MKKYLNCYDSVHVGLSIDAYFTHEEIFEWLKLIQSTSNIFKMPGLQSFRHFSPRFNK